MTTSTVPGHFIYLLQPYIYARLGEDTYKVGKTTQAGFRRLQGYPKESVLLSWTRCDDCHSTERRLLVRFRAAFTENNAGSEYFDGDCDKMMQMIVEECTNRFATAPTTTTPGEGETREYASERRDSCDGPCCNADITEYPEHRFGGSAAFAAVWENGCTVRRLSVYGRVKLGYLASLKGLKHSGVKKAELFDQLSYLVVEDDMPIPMQPRKHRRKRKAKGKPVDAE